MFEQTGTRRPVLKTGDAARRSGARFPLIPKRAPSNGQTLRFLTQAAFAVLCIWIGVEFMLWHNAHSAGEIPVVQRPPGVEGFLPISALMSVWYWVQTGVFHEAHPAGIVILIAIVGVSVLFRKSFCSWFCPVGTLSESIGEFGKKLFKRNFLPWKVMSDECTSCLARADACPVTDTLEYKAARSSRFHPASGPAGGIGDGHVRCHDRSCNAYRQPAQRYERRGVRKAHTRHTQSGLSAQLRERAGGSAASWRFIGTMSVSHTDGPPFRPIPAASWRRPGPCTGFLFLLDTH